VTYRPAERIERTGATKGVIHVPLDAALLTVSSLKRLKVCSYHTLNLISTDLISSEPSGCEATQVAVAATNQNAVARTQPT